MQSKATSIDQYIAEAPPDRHAPLVRLRALGRKIHADAEEGIDYGMPVLKVDGVMRLAFASQKNHIALYGLGADTIERHKAELKGVELGKGCIKYRKADAIDFALVETMMVEARATRSSGGC